MTHSPRLRPVSRPAPASVEPARLFLLDVAIAILNFLGRVKF